MKLSIIMPVYNEKDYFEQLLDRVIKVEIPLEKEIIIIEGNSNDGTKELIKKYQNKRGFKIIYETKPNGKGAAVRKGIEVATGDVILIQDADLEYKPEEYPILLKPIIDGKADFVLGSRHLGMNTWQVRKFDYSRWYGHLVNVGAVVLYKLFYLLYGVNLTDPQTMYKVFKKECIKDIQFKSNKFDLDWEIVIKLVKKGYIPIEVPISYKARTLEEGKKIRLWRDGPLALWTIIKYKFINNKVKNRSALCDEDLVYGIDGYEGFWINKNKDYYGPTVEAKKEKQ